MWAVLIVVVGGIALWQTDLDSASGVHSVVAPCMVAIATMALSVWVVLFFKRRGVRQTFDSMND
jgi:uncharacterized membrane protein